MEGNLSGKKKPGNDNGLRAFYDRIVPERVIMGLDREIRQSIRIVSRVPEVGIRGGIARLVALQYFNWDNKCDSRRVAQEQDVNDLDVFTSVPNLVRDREILGARYRRVASKLGRAGLPEIDPEDFGMFEGQEFVQAMDGMILGNDFTLNEVAIYFADGQCHLRYTNAAWRDLINGMGYLNPNQGLVWYKNSLMCPSSLGLARMLKFMVRGRVNKVFMPPWWLKLYRQCLENPKLPLSTYSLIAFEHYARNQEERQRMLQIMNEWGLTQETHVGMFVKAQQAELLGIGTPFEFDKRTFDEILEAKVLGRIKARGAKDDRKRTQEGHAHEFIASRCEECDKGCMIERCTHPGCTKFRFEKKYLPCTNATKRALIPQGKNWYYVSPWSR